MQPIKKILMKSTLVCQGNTNFIVKKNLATTQLKIHMLHLIGCFL